MFRSASLFIGTSFTVAFFTIFATSNVDSIVGIPHKIYSMQRILIHIKKSIFLLNVPICPQGMQQTWWPEASTIIVTGPYWTLGCIFLWYAPLARWWLLIDLGCLIYLKDMVTYITFYRYIFLKMNRWHFKKIILRVNVPIDCSFSDIKSKPTVLLYHSFHIKIWLNWFHNLVIFLFSLQ